MAVIHDMIPAFELFQPADTDGAPTDTSTSYSPSSRAVRSVYL